MPTVEYLPVATASGANVESQADFAGSAHQEDGFVVGTAQPSQANKMWRQSSMIGACVANMISQVLDIDVLDDGDITGLTANFIDALDHLVAGSTTPEVIPVTWSATPALNFAAGNPLFPVFEITLTGNTAPTVSGMEAGQRVTLIIIQDGTGSHTWTWPAGFNNFGSVDPTAGSVSIAEGIVASGGAAVYATGAIAG